MKPEDFRQLSIKPGSILSLIDCEDLGWSYDERVKGTLKSYTVVERHWPAPKAQEIWDAGVILSLPAPLQMTMGASEFCGDELLLIHRHPTTRCRPYYSWNKADSTFDNPTLPWDDYGHIVLVFGIQQGETLGKGPIALGVWQPKTAILSCDAVMLVEDMPNPSEMSRAFQRSSEWRKLEAMLDAGLITPQEHEAKRAEVVSRFPYQVD